MQEVEHLTLSIPCQGSSGGLGQGWTAMQLGLTNEGEAQVSPSQFRYFHPTAKTQLFFGPCTSQESMLYFHPPPCESELTGAQTQVSL